MSETRGLIQASILIISLMCYGVPAQPNVQSSGGKSDWFALDKLETGTRVYVKATRGAEYEGGFQGVTADSLVLSSVVGAPNIILEVKRAEVREVRKRRSDFAASAIGTGIGVGLGVAIGAAIGAGVEARAPYNDDPGLATMLFGFLGGLYGSITGKAFSGKFKKGEKIYVAP